MRDFSKLKLDRDFEFEEKYLRSLGITEQEFVACSFSLYEKDKIGYCLAWHEEWERTDFFSTERCLLYEELVKAKEYLWEDTEIVFQVHPRRPNIYLQMINIELPIFCLHRSADVTERAEASLRKKMEKLYLRAKEYYKPNIEQAMVPQDMPEVLVIYGGNRWPSWKEIEEYRKRYWGKNEKVLQFYGSREVTLNPEHIIMLWKTENFELPDEYS